MRPKKIALFGGTFDPIHRGHVQLALEFARRLGLDKVLLMPTFVPPHKVKPDMAPAKDRLAMCRLASAASPVLDVSDLEIDRGGASFTADTLEALHGQYPDAQWYLITGADMFMTIGTWWRFEDILSMAVLCAAPRDDITKEKLQAYALKLEREGAHCVVEDIPLLPFSSTDIRCRLAAGKSVEGMVPPAVLSYIQRHGLYQSGESVPLNRDEQFIEIIRGRLTPKRFAHSMAVAERAQELALRYGGDAARAKTAGILHDILKDAGQEAQLQIFRDFGILLNTVEQHTPKVWHAHAGALFIEKILGLQDEAVVQAVNCHTTGCADMSLLDKILFVADFTSADRDYPDVEEMRRLSESSLDEAILYALRYTIRDLLAHNQPIHPDTFAAYNDLMCKN